MEGTNFKVGTFIILQKNLVKVYKDFNTQKLKNTKTQKQFFLLKKI